MPWKKCTTLKKNVFHIKIHEISPGAILKCYGLKATCLMNLYFKSEEDTMTNEIFLRLYIAPPHLRKNINLPNVYHTVCIPHIYHKACVIALARERQNSNKQLTAFFGGGSHSVCNTVYYKTMCFVYYQDSF